ncbi:MAG TPA: WbqC family protein [Anaerolineales bacterium]|nr:WbqC family protein [Anaerolineales bacterium]
MNCVILQPSYIPWRGYFDQIRRADVFVFYDDVQYDKNGWRNRNRIKTHQGLQWLTIPVHTKGVTSEGLAIKDVTIDWRSQWSRKHWLSLQQAYAKAPYFGDYAPLLQEFYQRTDSHLADLTIDLTIALARRLGINHTRFMRSSSLAVEGAKTDRLIAILTQLGADSYLSGPAARAYLEEEKFSQAGIKLVYMAYDYPEYPQLYPPYEPQVSILDLLFMTGTAALNYITGEVD